MRGVLVLVLSVTCTSLSFSSQSQDAGNQKLGGIEGHIVDAGSGEAIKRAIIILKRSEEPGTATYSDAKGMFRFEEVEPGPYTITAERDGFVKDPSLARAELRVVSVKPGTTEAGITLKLARSGAVSGRVFDADGEPVSGASVQILSTQQKGVTATAAGATTNDRGEYRAFNIPPGKYRVAVSYTPKFEHMQLRMQRSRSASATTDETYATTYYPGTIDKRQAAAIDVGMGADLQGLDVQLLRFRAVRLRGHVSGPGGSSPGAFIVVDLQPVRGPNGSQWLHTIVQDPKGNFELAHVLPGTYLLTATAALNDRLSARRVIEVGETDVEGIELGLAAPQRINGRVIVPQGRKLPEGLVLVLPSRERLDNQAGGIAQVDASGVFSVEAVPPGDYDVQLANTGVGDDLYIAAIRMGDDDVLRRGIHLDVSPTAPLDIVLKANGGSIECSVRTIQNDPVPEARVVLLPDPPRRAQLALHGECRTDAGGACTILGVTPGEYHLFALRKEEQLDFRDPDSSKDLEKFGKPVKVSEGDRQLVTLEPIPEDR